MPSAPLFVRLPFVLWAVTGLVWAQSRPMTQEQERALAGVKAYAEQYVHSLPDYMCIQTTRREIQPSALYPHPAGDEVRELVGCFTDIVTI